MKLLPLAGASAAAVALLIAGTGTANAYTLEPTGESSGSQREGNAVVGICGVHYRIAVDYNPENPGHVTLQLQPTNSFGPGADIPGGCDGWVDVRFTNYDNLPASRWWPYQFSQVHADRNGGPTTSVDLPTGSGRVFVTVVGTNHWLVPEGSVYGAFYQVP
ncbi:hypothetical protein LTV02_33070 [Nocardia yamanashiensis]|uniref:hypothetical protein n=1 Tax=Nocardia yamanashiensis TaxID=209247 RepID=UPI001E650C1B|nr:hypothetical protein [Nocardia yamanashiensis]UGT40769.1 hypothetical protein LTV02_33070 [Nocardia yamanashiensis]